MPPASMVEIPWTSRPPPALSSAARASQKASQSAAALAASSSRASAEAPAKYIVPGVSSSGCSRSQWAAFEHMAMHAVRSGTTRSKKEPAAAIG